MILFQANDKFKIPILFGSVLIAITGVLLFYKPTITGHVPVNIYIQNLSLIINESQNYLLTSDNLEPFIINSFKISGNIIGNGQVKVYINTGKGQKLLIYDNVAKKESKSGLSKITGLVTEAEEGGGIGESKNTANTNKNDKWLVIKPIKILLEKEVFEQLEEDKYLVNGTFSWQCRETCFISMEMSRNLAYRLVFLVENGTLLKIEQIIYQTKD